jgi:ABC-2 type transport system permease protein
VSPLPRAVRAELTKLRTLRSTWLVLALTVLAGIGLGVLSARSTAHAWAGMPAADRAALDPVGSSFDGLDYAELGFGALGVLAMTGEYATGMVRASLLAVPGRWLFVLAKALVVGGLGAVVGQVCAFTSFLAVQHALRPTGRAVQLEDPHVLRAVVAAGLYLAVVALVGLGIGAAVRHTGPAVVALVAVVFLAWPAARAVEGLSTLPSKLLLANAVDALVTVVPITGPQAARVPGAGLAWGVLAGYAVVALGVACWRAGRDT